MKFAKNKYPLCSASECEQDCIFFDKKNEHCNIGNTTELTQAILNHPKLYEYLKTLKTAHKRYREHMYKNEELGLYENKQYWYGMASCIEAIFNDLGLGYLLKELK